MPGSNCAIPGCTAYHRKGSGIAFFNVTKQNDEYNKEWREKVLSIIKKYREVDNSFKKQLETLKISICEDHYEESCIIRSTYS